VGLSGAHRKTPYSRGQAAFDTDNSGLELSKQRTLDGFECRYHFFRHALDVLPAVGGLWLVIVVLCCFGGFLLWMIIQKIAGCTPPR
jgi:hypothetical protein